MNNTTFDERWKDVKGYEGSYMVSNLGRVKSLDRTNAKGARIAGKILKTRFNNSGYEHVMLYRGSRKDKKNLFVHRLVAQHFIDNRKDADVNHKDGNKLNNSMNNLEWITKSANINHAYSKGLMKRCKTVKVTLPDGTAITMHNTAECSRYFGFSKEWVRDRVKKHGNTFEYNNHTIQVI